MKFRNLKKGKWAIHFDWFQQKHDEHYSVQLFCDNGKLKAFAESEYDNGLYTELGNYEFNLTWKDLKYNLTHYTLRQQKSNRMPYYVFKFKNVCDICGCPVDFVKNFDWGWKCEQCQIKEMAKIYGEDPEECWNVQCEMEKELHDKEWKNGEWVDILSNFSYNLNKEIV